MKPIDYSDFRHVSPSEQKKEAADAEQRRTAKKTAPFTPNRWWLANEDDIPGAVMQQVASIAKADSGRIDSYNKYARLYGCRTPTYWNGYALANSGRPSSGQQDRLAYNIVQSCVDTLVSLVTQNRPKPMFLTSMGDSKIQRRAQKLDKYVYGTFFENQVYQLQPITARDSYIFGEGITHPYIEAGKMKYERVMPYEIMTDYLEAHYGPRSTKTLHRIKNIDRTELAEMYKHHRDKIWTMPGTAHFMSASNRSVGDTVTVVQSWRLPVGERKGIVTTCTSDILLDMNEYNEEFFPFAIQRFSPSLYGFYSTSLAEQLVPIQVEINRTLISIQRSLYLGGTHKIFIKAGSRIIKSHFDNLTGTIVEYAGDTPPQYVVPQLVQPEIYAHLNSMLGMGYQQPGISQMGATSVKTPGVNSGRAMRTEQNINTQRHKTLEEAYQNSYVDLARITVAVAKKEYERGGVLSKIKVPGKRFIEEIDWKECSLENDQFILQIYPVSKLPNEPEGRIESIIEMMEGGLMDPATGRRLLDFPDLDEEESLANAQRDYLHKVLDGIVDSGDYVAPEEDDNLQLAKKLVLEYIARGKLNNLSEDKLEDLRTWSKQIDLLTTPPQQEEAQAPEQQITPQANPIPTPTNELIPNVNVPGAQ